MNRITTKFNELRVNKEKALLTFVTAGDPSLEETIEQVLAMEKAGADIIELGIPYSDPLADGPIIQASSQRAMAAGISNIMDTVKEIRKLSGVPLLYLVYYNCIFRYGIEKFMSECEASGIDGLIIPDLPLEERSELSALADNFNVYLIPMIAPTSEERIEKIVRNGKGFVYCVSVAGVTGVRDKIDTDIKAYMDTLGSYSPIPKIIGFGISNAEMARNFKDMCDGVVVGSAIIKKLAEQQNKDEAIEVLISFVRELKEALG